MSDPSHLLDASAVLALFFGEDGSARVERVLDGAAISAVNLVEVVSKLRDKGLSTRAIADNLTDANLQVIVFGETTAMRTAALREPTRKHGLSLADRACLATAELTGRIVVTADRAWSALSIGIAIEVIR